MKTLYLNDHGSNIYIDPENNSAEWLDSEREAIQRIYIAPEDMHVVYSSGEYKRELDVKEGDLIITFYTPDFEHRVISVTNSDWVENLEKDKARQRECKMCACEPCDVCENCQG